MFDEQQFLEDLKVFINFKTIVNKNPEEFKKARKWIKNFFNSKTTQIIEIPSNKYTSLIIKPKDSKKPKMLGDGHIEVVPASDDYFTLKQEGRHIKGRGVADMKTQCLIMMHALRDTIKGHDHSDFWIALTEDEEAGSPFGVKEVIKYLNERNILPDFIFSPDSGPDFAYVEKEKGTMAGKISLEGKAAHASRPFLGDNPIDKMQKINTELKQTFPNPTDGADWRISYSMTTIQSGVAVNKIPQVCDAEFDCRFTENDSADAISKKIAKIAESHNASVEFYFKDPATYYPKEGNIPTQFRNILHKVSGKKPEIIHATGASNGRIYAAFDPSISVLMSSPKVVDLHGENECIDLSSIKPFYELVCQSAKIVL